jgi:hypothetical protein
LAKHWIRALAVVAVLALVAAAIASAEKPVRVQVGDVITTFNVGVRPKRLPKSKLAPIALTFSNKVKTASGSHPPALKKIVIEADKNSAINSKGVPVCAMRKLQAKDIKGAKAACPKAIVGKGKMSAQIQFPGQVPLIAKSKLLAFNGGNRGGKTTIYIYAYLSSPVAVAVITTVKVSRIHRGRFGLKLVASLPAVAGGYGSTVGFRLRINRKFTYKGKRQSYLLASCTDGHLSAMDTAVFQGAPSVSTQVVRSCTPKG